MNRNLLVALIACFVVAGCTAHKSQFGLERLDKADIAESESLQSDIGGLEARANALLNVCVADKFTSKLTYDRLAGFFELADERDAFVSTFAARLREAKFRRDTIKSYKIERVAIETNEVVGFVRARLKGHFWGPLNTELVEVVVWKKVGDKWFVWPQQQK